MDEECLKVHESRYLIDNGEWKERRYDLFCGGMYIVIRTTIGEMGGNGRESTVMLAMPTHRLWQITSSKRSGEAKTNLGISHVKGSNRTEYETAVTATGHPAR